MAEVKTILFITTARIITIVIAKRKERITTTATTSATAASINYYCYAATVTDTPWNTAVLDSDGFRL